MSSAMDTALLENPLREGLRLPRTPPPCAVVIFGATGDLTHRKLVPALYSLASQRLLPGGFSVVGVGRRPWSTDDFRAEMRRAVHNNGRFDGADASVWRAFEEGLFYVAGAFEDPATFDRLAGALVQVDAVRGTAGNRLFYLATPPDAYPLIIERLASSGLSRSPGGAWARIVIEKPFGSDLASARDLNQRVLAAFPEEQVFRIDHYLGKETVQNILVFRFSNGIWEPLWNRRYVDHVQITVAESIGVENRGRYYEEAGALRDIVQNHMLQLLTLTAMEPPSAFAAGPIRDEKVKVLYSMDPLTPEQVTQRAVRGQYGPGYIAGEAVPGYRQEPNVDPASTTETFVALKLFIDSWRWAGVPFYLRTGKRLPRRVTEIAVHFKSAPQLYFQGRGARIHNVLALRLQPDEGISLSFGVKVPGAQGEVRSTNMDFRYGMSFGQQPPEAYERLLLDAMVGDPTLYTRADWVEAAWRIVDSVRREWDAVPSGGVPVYAAGTWGPAEAEAMMERDGHRWRRP